MMIRTLERSMETDVFRGSDPRAYDDFLLRPRPVLRRLADASDTRRVVFKAL